jgi:hypothetical protein
MSQPVAHDVLERPAGELQRLIEVVQNTEAPMSGWRVERCACQQRE